MTSLADKLLADITVRFSHGESFSIADFPELCERHGIKYVSSSLRNLSRSAKPVFCLAGQRKHGCKTQNVYQVKDKQEVEYQPGDATRWHKGIPEHDCADGEVYRVRFWDRTEGLRAWRNGWWWTEDGKKLARDFVMEYSGVVR